MSFGLTVEVLERARDQARRANNMQLCANCKTPFEAPRLSDQPGAAYPRFADSALCTPCLHKRPR